MNNLTSETAILKENYSVLSDINNKINEVTKDNDNVNKEIDKRYHKKRLDIKEFSRLDKLIQEKHINDSKTHSEKLMPLIDEILKTNNVTLNDIDLFACGVGPGSFTGVRIGVSTIKAFVDSSNKPCVAVSSFESLACSAL